MIGIKIMIVRGSMFCMISLGMPCSSMVAAGTTLATLWQHLEEGHDTLRGQIRGHLAIYEPINRIEYKDSACNEGTLELFDEMVAPRSFVLSAMLLLVRRFGSICVEHQTCSDSGIGHGGQTHPFCPYWQDQSNRLGTH